VAAPVTAFRIAAGVCRLSPLGVFQKFYDFVQSGGCSRLGKFDKICSIAGCGFAITRQIEGNMSATFLFEKEGPITTLTFNQPEHRNFMNHEVMREMEELIRKVRDDRETRVLITTGTGPAFSAGAELSMAKDVADRKEQARIMLERNKGLARVIGRVFDLITRLDCMTIAAVNGHAVGGGWAIVTAFDFVLAVEEAEFWVPEVDLNQAYIGGPAHVMALRMGPWRAKEAMILCRRYTARELFQIGMVNKVVKAEELLAQAREVARALARKNARAATATKHFVDGAFVGPRWY
jgi:enoyl-CoA hydratase/carnithine racemase